MMQGPAMSLLKHLLLLPALLLLSIIPTESRVVTSITDCDNFFLGQTPPHIPGILEAGNILDQNRYKLICQTLHDTTTFVTLYDTRNRIPVFSAAKYRGSTPGRPKKLGWMIEPQLENLTDNSNMRTSNEKIIYDHQAGNQDYRYTSEFDRGHLFPSSYGHAVVEKNSTFTLTNIVPQRKKFNQGSWSKMEQCIRCILNEYCINNNKKIEGFVVIGAQPSNRNILNNRINIPSMLWSAFCCYSHSLNTWLASAHWGENVADGPTYLQTKTLAELHRNLGGQLKAFPRKECPLHTTVTHLYSELSPNCNCPPLTSTFPSPTTTATPSSTTSGPFTTTSDPPSTASSTFSTTSGFSTSDSPSTRADSFTTTSDQTTSGPFTTTAGFSSTTSGLSTTTSGLSRTTSSVTSDSSSTTSGLSIATSGLSSTTSGPFTTTAGPSRTTSGLSSTTSGPSQTTSGHFSTTSGPSRTTSSLSSTTSGPSQTTSGHFSTTSGPSRTTSSLSSTTSGPSQTTSGH
uniref:Endonuclease domain-containing 1 protein-like n=1 Tax=Astyanax mexicanus TaxID=7994 RepID=A0A8B9L099_ASTMX